MTNLTTIQKNLNVLTLENSLGSIFEKVFEKVDEMAEKQAFSNQQVKDTNGGRGKGLKGKEAELGEVR